MKTNNQPAIVLSAEVSAEIAQRSADCGIPVEELATMMAREGLRQYDGPGITVRAKKPSGDSSSFEGLGALTDAIQVSHGFAEEEWRRIQKKAAAQGCDAIAMLNTAAAMFGSTDELVPLWLPQRIVNRLAEAGEAADIEDPFDGIAKAILGDLVESSDNLLDVLSQQWPDVPKKRLAAVRELAEQWQAEDATTNPGTGDAQ